METLDMSSHFIRIELSDNIATKEIYMGPTCLIVTIKSTLH